MYEAHFGLTSRPFGSKAEGAGIFSGPRQVETMTSVKKGLTALDAVVTVTGPVGVGKTSIVSRALDTISPNRMAAWVGRMQLAPDEVLHLLLAGFGVKAQAKGTIQRFAVFRRLLAERAAAGAPVAIVVEDANRIGVDALAELEALTAADTGDATGANIILMGQPNLKKLLAQPELARLNQRTRLRQAIEPLAQTEVNGYLKHCVRAAGGEYDKIFEAGVAEIVFACSDGIPRMINTLCASAMAAAMEDGLTSVPASLMHKVAVNAFGYEGPVPQAVTDTPSEDSVEVPVIEVKVDAADNSFPVAGKAGIDADAPPAPATGSPVGAAAGQSSAETYGADDMDLPSARDMIVESGHYPALPEAPEESRIAEPENPETVTGPEAAGVEAESETKPSAEPTIPELINDTQPELSVLPPKTDEAAIDVLDVDTESTAIQEQLSEDALKDPAPEARAEAIAEPEPRAEPPAARKSPDPSAAKADQAVGEDEQFDLDAALSFETEATNIMEGVTANLDEVVADADKETSASVPTTGPAANASSSDTDNEPNGAPVLDDLPTLTDSMQVDVEKEVEKAKQLEPEQPAIGSPDPAIAAQTEETPDLRVTPDAKPVASEAEPSPAAARQPVEPPAEPAVKEPETLPTMTEEAAPAEPGKAAIKPIAQVSEMTARIAALDPANRTNDVDAVEAALDAAKRGTLEEMMAPPSLSAVNGATVRDEETSAPIPEITLDDAIEKKQEAAAARRKEFAAEIGSANSLEEFSDAMAETLFGDDDFDAIAAEVAANPPDNGELALQGNTPPEIALADEPAPGESLAPAPSTMPGEVGRRESNQFRADMRQSLDAGSAAPVQKVADISPAPAAPPASTPQGGQLESIEDQINTSLTQSLQALNISQAADASVAVTQEVEEPAKKGGFFSRFRKSS